MTQEQATFDKRLDRVIRDVEVKTSSLAHCKRSEYKPLTDANVDQFHKWKRRFEDQLACHGLQNFLLPNYHELSYTLPTLSDRHLMFTGHPALLEKYYFAQNMTAELVAKQLMFVKTVFEEVFQDSGY